MRAVGRASWTSPKSASGTPRSCTNYSPPRYSHHRLVLASPIPQELRQRFLLTGTLRLFTTVRSRRSSGLV
ncbi:hypothetical protein [Streptomyces sp. BE133]|uniref:hypothetical protein n=1 Tax=Streptomyces sp. BE133 TaxID=3002523 RepID=UPI002E76F7B8|nr:hypothetical protein [Streptomyces sp. BE133]MEE1813323.1 hypothetical protein [Streptomyces sp. BE133]